ncbi:hypothetical protein [Castellaniella sp.]|uniref:hypothetical protein n=1 Tax=Castellaniella sp. TaxID=1955812 RepID=UPI003C75AC87
MNFPSLPCLLAPSWMGLSAMCSSPWLAVIEGEQQEDVQDADAVLTMNYVRAFTWRLGEVRRRGQAALDQPLILETHRGLMSSSDRSKMPGRYRTVQNWIGDLLALGILQAVSGRCRNRLWNAPTVIAAMTDGMQKLAEHVSAEVYQQGNLAPEVR